MEEEKIYINPNDPVYISYAWNREEDIPAIKKGVIDDLEEDVNQLCELFKQDKNNMINYRRDKDKDDAYRLIRYGRSIAEAAREIGNGIAIIIIVSDKYLKSLDCLYELHCIRTNNNFEDKVFPIVLKDCNLANIQSYKDNLKQVGQSILNKIFQGDPLKEIEKQAVKAMFFKEDLDSFYTFITNNSHDNVFNLREVGYTPILNKLKKYIEDSQKKIIRQNEVNSFIFNKSVLLIGDSILQYNTKDSEGRDVIIPLGEYIGQEILKKINGTASLKHKKGDWERQDLSGLRAWNREFGEEKRQDVSDELSLIITRLKSDKNVIKSLLEDLVLFSNFDVIISVGYCNDIIKTVIEGASKTVQFKNLNITGGFDLVNERGNDVLLLSVFDSLVCSQWDIANKVNACVATFEHNAISKNQILSKNANLLALGTDLPGWALRHIYTSLSVKNNDDNIINRLLIFNKTIDVKTSFYVGNIPCNYNTLLSFVDKWKQYVSPSIRYNDNSKNIINHTKIKDNKQTPVYVIFLENEYTVFLDLYQEVLSQIENNKLIFVWKVQDIKKEEKNKIKKCIIMYDNGQIPSLPNQQQPLLDELNNYALNKDVLLLWHDINEVERKDNLFYNTIKKIKKDLEKRSLKLSDITYKLSKDYKSLKKIVKQFVK